MSSAERCVLPNGPTTLRESPPPFIDKRRDSVHAQGIMKVIVVSPNRGGAVVVTVGSTLWGIAPGVAVILGIVLGLAEIAPAS